MIFGRGERLVRVLNESVGVMQVDSGGILRRCMCHVCEEESCKFVGCHIK